MRTPRMRGGAGRSAPAGGLGTGLLALWLVLTAAVVAADDPPLADAARRGDLAAVRSLLAEGADVDGAHGDGMTALHWAADRGDLAMAEVLLAAGGDPSATTRLGSYTPLHLASRSGAGEVVRALVEGGAPTMAVTSTGAVTALHFAAAAGSADAIEVLLSGGAQVDARETAWGQTPLMFAAAYDRARAIEVLLRHGADPTLTAFVIDIAARDEADRADQRGAPRDEPPPSALPPGARSGGATGAAAGRATGAATTAGARAGGRALQEPIEPNETTPLSYAGLIGTHGGLTPLLIAARDGHQEAAAVLLDGGAPIDQLSEGHETSPLLMALINGHFDLGLMLLERGADPTLESVAGATPLYAAINVQWAPKSRHPQPTDYHQQQASYLDVMRALLDAGVDPDIRLARELWYTTYNNDLLSVDWTGATAFFRAAHALDVQAMELLVSYGADPTIPTLVPPRRGGGRTAGRGGGRGGGERADPSGLPPLEPGDGAVYPIHAASGVGHGQGYAGNSHRHVPEGWLAAVRYLVEVHGADVNARDLNGYAPVHHAAARGDTELILYLVEQGADVTAVSRRGQTTADMANGPVQRVTPYPDAVALLERLGSKNNHRCTSC